MPIIQEIQENHHSRRHADNQDTPQTPPPPPPPPQQPESQPHPNPKPNTNSGPKMLLFLFLKWVIMAFVLSLFLIFIGFAALVLLHFLLTTTTVHRRRRSHNLQFPHHSANPTSSLYSMQDLHDLLPYLSYSVSAQTTRDCAICLEGFKEGELCRQLLDCAHLFHVNCVDSWLTKVPNCPICRTRVQLGSGSGSKKNEDNWKLWWPVGV